MHTYDVVIMGGGLAGQFLARQLRLTRPELTVLVIEAALKIEDYKVGESTVEVAAHYMVRRLNLGTYLYQHQLPKNGLRFFFDSAEKDLPLTEMSEIGSDHLPHHPSFQLNRATLERDLVEMNRAAGVQVELGAKITDLTVDGGTQHTVTYEQDGATHTIGSRWLVDASGRRHLLARKLGLEITKETRLNTGAGWARYENLPGMDEVRDPGWRARVKYTSRYLSTNHMNYDGYWLWFIPLNGDVMSVGAVYDKDRLQNPPRNARDFDAFMRSHRSSRDLMEGSKLVDYGGYAHLPYHTDRFYSRDRWALVGESGAFPDPFYSPGSDFIATANEFTTSLILSETSGDTAAFHDKVDVYNAYHVYKYENVIRLYIGMYPMLGSYEAFRLKYLLDFNNYYNLVVWPYMDGRLTDVSWLREELRISDRILQAISQSMLHMRGFSDTLLARGEYFAQNRGRFANGLNGVQHMENVIDKPIDPDFRRREVDKAFGSVFASLLERFADAPGFSTRECVLRELGVPQVMLYKEVNEESFRRLLSRVASGLERDLRKEFPGETIEKVVIADRAADVDVLTASPERERILVRAGALWKARGNSLTSIGM
ncbi:MAG: NAD(P)/FAD-dependent oxidoreductase [Deltaproteobacteria bacterium]